MSDPSPEIDLCFGTDEEMLDWAKREGLEVVRDQDGGYDWAAVYEEWEKREDA